MSELSTIQTQVLSGLLSGQSVAAVAREHGIHRSTIYNWRKDHPHFTFALDQARSRLQDALYDETQDLVAQSLEVFAGLLHSQDDRMKFRVAQAILRLANPARPTPELRTNVGLEHLMDRDPSGAASIPHRTPTVREGSKTTSAPATTPATSEVSKSVEFRRLPTPGRNQPCPCKSGLKYKKCCGNPSLSASPRVPPASSANPRPATGSALDPPAACLPSGM